MKPRSLFLAASLLLVPIPSWAGSRLFSYVYETTTQPVGAVEVENSVTWVANAPEGHRINSFDFRHELEWGVTDHFQLSLYVADWNYTNSGSDKGTRYQDTAVEGIYNLTNPNLDWLGSALYGEVRIGDKVTELEGKVLLQKNIGPLVLGYNVALEAVWEGDKSWNWDGTSGEFSQSLGASYELNPHFCAGAELLNEVEWVGWGKPTSPRVFAGPNASVRFGHAWVTITPLVQLTHQRDEATVQTRLIFGYEF